jgi:hypothetical protein
LAVLYGGYRGKKVVEEIYRERGGHIEISWTGFIAMACHLRLMLSFVCPA